MPSITSWTRLEPRCRDADMRYTVNARVFDPMWMLTRQWQVGEYQGEDRGSPVQVKLSAQNALLSRCHLGALAPNTRVQAAPYDPHAMPLEVWVERQRVRPQAQADATHAHRLALAVEAGLHFLRLLDQRAAPAAYRGAFIARYALLAPAASTLDSLDAETRSFIDMMVSRAPDARRLEAAFRPAGPSSDAVVIDAALSIAPADRGEVEQCVRRWLAWYDSLFTEPSSGAGAAWQPERLEYAVSVAGRLSADPFDEVPLSASVGVDGRLDWSDFDINPEVNLGTDVPSTSTTLTQTTIAAPVTFRGAPAVRFWEFEDARVDYGLVPVGPTDLAHLLLIEYAGSYGNDWFVIPVELPVGSLTRVSSLIVSDTFGVRTLHRPLGDPNIAPAHWSMFQLAHTSSSGLGPQSNLFFLPPAIGSRLESVAQEDVMFMRDEMANMAWAIERVIESPIERPIERADPRATTPTTAPAPAPSASVPVYDLASDVPAHWVPLLPVQVPQPSGEPLPRLKRGAVLVADGSQQVRTALGQILNPGAELLLYDEEVPREGVRVTRHYKLARWLDGSTFLWAGQRSQVGRGEGASALSFDQLRAPDAAVEDP